MSILAWNVRGLNGPKRWSDVFNVINNNRPAVVGLLETKIHKNNMVKFDYLIPQFWTKIDNLSHVSKCRILVLVNN